MTNIVICDHDAIMLDTVVELINKMVQKDGLKARVVCATAEVCEARQFVQKNKGNYLFFVDYSFGDDNLTGIDFARLIKIESAFSKVVFFTDHMESCLHILKSGVEAFGAIDKGIDATKIGKECAYYIALAGKVMKDPMAFQQMRERQIMLQVNSDEFIAMPVSQIAYVETVKTIPHFICYHTIDGSGVSVRDTIEHAVDLLGDEFIKSHRSSAINKRYVVGVEDGYVKLSNGASAACAIKRKSAIARACLC